VKRGALAASIGEGSKFVAAIINLQIFFLRRASSISRVQIAAPIVLAHYKGHERISKARKHIRHTLLIVTELA
jgi:hypothetical protein